MRALAKAFRSSMPDPSLPLAVICSSLALLLLARGLFRRGEFGLLARLFGFPRLLFARCLRRGGLQLSLALFLVRLALGAGSLRLLFGFRRLGLPLAACALRRGFRGGTIPFGLFGSLLGFGSLAFGFRGPRLLLGLRRPGAALVVFALSRRGLLGPDLPPPGAALPPRPCAPPPRFGAPAASRSSAAFFRTSIRCCALTVSGESGKRLMNRCNAAGSAASFTLSHSSDSLVGVSRLGVGGCGSAARLTLRWLLRASIWARARSA